MTEHEYLKKLASNPGLIETESELDELLDHVQSCSDCSQVLNQSTALLQAAAMPLMKLGPHLSPLRIALLRWKKFRPGIDTCRNLPEWHLTNCSLCRTRHLKAPTRIFVPVWRWVSAIVVLVFAGGLFVYWKSTHPEEGAQRASTSLALIQPADGFNVTPWQEFKWTEVGATKYTFVVREKPSGNKVLEKEVSQNFLVLGQQDASSLHVDAEYSWSVTAFVGSRSFAAPSRTFRFVSQILPPAANDEIRRLRRMALHGKPEEMPGIREDLRKQLILYPSGIAAAQIRSSIGDAFYREGLHKEAVVEFKAALQIWEEVGSPDVYDEQRTYNNLALAFQRIGDFSSAMSAYRTSHAVLRKLSDPRFELLRSNCAVNEATLERRLGNYHAAREHLEEALEIDRHRLAEGLDKDESHLADDLNNLGNLIMEELEDPQTGLNYLLQAQEIHQRQEKMNGKPDDNAGDTEDSIGVANELLGRDDKAIAQFRKALDRHKRGISDTTALDQTLNSFAELLLKKNDLPQAFVYLQQAQKLRPQPNPDEWWHTEELLGQYYVAVKDYKSGEKHLGVALQIIQQFISTLPVSEQRVYRAEHLRPVFAMAQIMILKGNIGRAFMCLASAQSQQPPSTQSNWCNLGSTAPPPSLRLPADHVALSYFAGDSNAPILCFMLTGDGRITVHELKTSKDIESEIRAYLRSQDSPLAKQMRQQLAADLLPPPLLQSLLKKEVKRILITPVAGLNRLSFESLIPDANVQGAHSSLIDNTAIEIIPSVLAWTDKTARHCQPKDALIVTAAGSSACPTESRLPWADKEATEIAKFASSNTRLLRGTPAKEAVLGNEVSQFRILHFAVHGQAAHSLEGSELLLDCASHDVLDGDRIKDARLSGQLVVLSACESAVGKVSNGEGIDSLADVFLRAGASCVVASRSRISDKGAYDLMNYFYRELSQHNPIDISLQHAQQYLEDKLPTQEWGAFSAFGKCDETIQITPSILKRLELKLGR